MQTHARALSTLRTSVVLVQPRVRGSTETELREARGLAEATDGWRVLSGTALAVRGSGNPLTLFGKGQVERIGHLIEAVRAEAVAAALEDREEGEVDSQAVEKEMWEGEEWEE